MLKKLIIDNFVLVDHCEIDLGKGFNILTGETGSGKSVILNSIISLTQPRLSSEVIGHYRTESYLEGTFTISPTIQHWLHENQISQGDIDSEITISRQITPKGSRSRINGQIVQSKTLPSLAKILFEIHSQNSTYEIFSSEGQLNYIDNTLSPDSLGILHKYKTQYTEYKTLQKQIETLKQQSLNNTQELDFTEYQYNEIEKLNLSNINEENELQQTITEFSQLEKINSFAQSLYSSFTEGELNISQTLNKYSRELQTLSKNNPNLDKYSQEFQEAYENLSTCIEEIYHYNISMDEFSLEHIDTLNDRLNSIQKLKRKHNAQTIEELLTLQKSLKEKISNLQNSHTNLESLEKQEQTIHKTLLKLSNELHKARQINIQNIESHLQSHLKKLKMGSSQIKITIEQTQELLPTGNSEIHFLMSTNKDNQYMPISKIASGGEKSRIALLLRSINTSNTQEHTYPIFLFDEIDNGTSGAVAEMIGQKLLDLSKSNQIICVTHQPLVACYADNHYLISKESVNNKNSLSLNTLQTDPEKQEALLSLITGIDNQNAPTNFIDNLLSRKKSYN